MSIEIRSSQRAATRARCPFCHEDLAADGDDVSTCSRCGAPHHDACFSESLGCATCREDERREPVGRVRRRRRRRVRGIALVLAFGALGGLVPTLGQRTNAWLAGHRAAQARAAEAERAAAAAVEEAREADEARARVRDAAECYLNVALEDPSSDGHEARLARVVTRASLEVLELDDFVGERDSLGSGTVPRIASVELTGKDTALVRANGHDFRFVRRENEQWLADLVLADDETTAWGMCFRLPARLSKVQWNSWSEGSLGASVRRMPDDFFDEVSHASGHETPEGERLRRSGTGAERIAGIETVIFTGETARESLAVAFLEIRPTHTLRYMLRARRGHREALERVLRASLATVHRVREKGVAGQPMCQILLGEQGPACLVPDNSFGRWSNGIRVDVRKFSPTESPLRWPSEVRGDMIEALGSPKLLSKRVFYRVPNELEWALTGWYRLDSERGLVVTVRSAITESREQALERLTRVLDEVRLADEIPRHSSGSEK